MAFHVIFVAPGLSEQDRERAVVAGPAHAAAAENYPDLLTSAGFDQIEEVDVTNQYRRTAAAWLNESTRATPYLEQSLGIEEFRRGQQERQKAQAAIEGGLLRRSLFAARAS